MHIRAAGRRPNRIPGQIHMKLLRRQGNYERSIVLYRLGNQAGLAGRALYGDAVTGRISVGVVLPEGDRTARQAASMLSSMESVKSLCDFIYMDEEACRESLAEGELAAALLVPDDLVSGIMNGENTPITAAS